MSYFHELIVSFNRLTLPTHLSPQKVDISIFCEEQQFFCQNPKNVKQHKVMLYGEKLSFLFPEKGFEIRVYDCTIALQKHPIKVFEISQEKIYSVKKQAALFNSSEDGFNLIWECKVFREYIQQFTDRDYTQFKSDHDYLQKDQHFSNIFSPSKMKRSYSLSMVQQNLMIYKQRCNSTQQSQESTDKNVKIILKQIPMNNEKKKSEEKRKNRSRMQKKESMNEEERLRRPRHIKSMLYRNLMQYLLKN